MKKLLFTLVTLLAWLPALAQNYDWSTPDRYDYQGRYAVFAKIMVNGADYSKYSGSIGQIAIAAFVEDECRQVLYQYPETLINHSNGTFQIDVWGNPSDEGKTVTFKIRHNDVVYKMTKTLTYRHGETYTPIPLVLNLDAITGVSLPESVEINQKIGTTYDMSQHVTYKYDSFSPEVNTYTPLGESAVDSECTPVYNSWRDAQSTQYFTVDGPTNLLTINDVTPPDGAYLGLALACSDGEYEYTIGETASTMVKITEPQIPVTNLTLKQNRIEAWVGENLLNDYLFKEGFVTITPADASNKNFRVNVSPENEEGISPMEKFQIMKAGTWTVDVVSSDNENVKQTLTVIAKQHVESLQVSSEILSVNVGDNVFNAIKNLITVLPENAYDKTLVCQPETLNVVISEAGVALRTGQETVRVYSQDNPQAFAIIQVTVLQPVTSIVAPREIECWNGENLWNILEGKVTVAPDDASNKSWMPELTQGDPAGLNEKYTFVKGGDYVVTLRSQSNQNVTATVNIKVKNHVENIETSIPNNTLFVNVGDDVFTAIKNSITITPDDAFNKQLIIVAEDETYINAQGIALKSNKNMVTAFGTGVTVTSADNPDKNISFRVVISNPIQAIAATPERITVTQGENVLSYIQQNVRLSFTPAEPDNVEVYIKPSANDKTQFPDSIATNPGTYTWEIISQENEAVKTTITVKVAEAVSIDCTEEVTITNLTPGTIDLTITSGADSFDPSLVDIEFNEPGFATVTPSADGLHFTVTANKLTPADGVIFNVLYDGEALTEGTLFINAEIALKAGWNWISNYSNSTIAFKDWSTGEYASEYFTGANKIIEARTQDQLLYVDEQLGVFGQLDMISGGQMAKIKVAADRSLVSPAMLEEGNQSVNIYYKGYQWFGYPLVNDHSFTYFNGSKLLLDASEGDMIIGQNGFAEFANGRWIAADDFKLEVGKGYIYYNTQGSSVQLDFGPQYVEDPVEPKSKAYDDVNVWQYDVNAFPETMCIVAKVDGLEASDRFSIGAFVNGECRGKGSFVTDDVMFISVAGKQGEVVEFQVYDKQNNEYLHVYESLSYASKAGSINAPVQISVDQTTGIGNLKATDKTDAPAYNTMGQRVNAKTKGFVIKQGKKYINK